MTTLLYSHQACIGHDTGSMHPESPARLKAILAALEARDGARLGALLKDHVATKAATVKARLAEAAQAANG